MIVVKDLHIYDLVWRKELLFVPELIIDDGHICFFKGDSGKGKTLLMKTLTNQHHFYSGNIIIDEKMIESYSVFDFASKVQCVDQHYYLFNHMSALDQLVNPLHVVLKKDHALATEMAKNALQDIGLYEDRHKLPSELSGGQRQRMSILQKIIMNPDYLFLDEPTSGLDKKNKFKLLYFLDKHFYNGMKIILSSHDFETINFFDKKYIFELL